MWNSTPEQDLAGEELKKKIFEFIEDRKYCLNERKTRQILKSMYTTWIFLVDTDIDKSDSDRLLYDIYDKVNEYCPTNFDKFENLMIGLLV